MTSIRIRQSGRQASVNDLRRLPENIDTVANRVVVAVTEWAADTLADDVASASAVPRSVLLTKRGGPRIFVRIPKKKGKQGSIWFGSDPVPAEYVGQAVQTETGVSVGPHHLHGAFLARMPSGHVGVYQRRKPSTRHSRGRPAHWQPNIPLDSSGIDLDAEPAVLAIDARIPKELEKQTSTQIQRGLRRE